MTTQISSIFDHGGHPDEIMAFLVVVVLLALSAAFLIYSLVLVLLWHRQLRGVTSLGSLLFPSPGQLREYIGEYLLAVATSALLLLTMAAKQDIVDLVLEVPMTELTTEQLRQAFPLGDLRPEDVSYVEAESSELAGSLMDVVSGEEPLRKDAADYGVQALVAPLVRLGMPDRADLVLKAAIRHVARDPWQAFPTRIHLLTSASMLLFGYSIWLAYRRARAVAGNTGRPSPTNYKAVAKRMLLLISRPMSSGQSTRGTRSGTSRGS